MAIARKPVKTEKEIKQLIHKGGSVPATEANKELMRLQLRLPAEVVEQIDTLLAIRLVKPSRHTWFLEAIYEKMERERKRNES